MSKSQIFKYKTRVDLNLECLRIIDFFVKLESFDTLLIISQNDEDIEDEQQWQGVVNTIKNFTRQNLKNHREAVEKMITKQSQETQAKIDDTQAKINDTQAKIDDTQAKINDKIDDIQKEMKKEMMEMEQRIIAALKN